MLDAILIFFVILLVLQYFKSWSHPKHYPPGPRKPLPILGDAYVLGNDLVNGFLKLRRKYGKIYGMWLGGQRAVVVADFDVLQDILNKQETADRQQMDASPLLRKGQSLGTTPGVLFSNGLTWVEMRRTSLHTLRDFGFGKGVLEDIIEEEIDNLIHHIDNHCLDQPVDVRKFFNISVLASLWRIISGECLKIGDPKLETLVGVVAQLIKEAGSPLTGIAINSMPLLRFLNWTGIMSNVPLMNELFQFNLELIENHKGKQIDGDHPLTFTEAMLHKIQETKEDGNPFFDKVGELNLANVLVDLFIAGADTTSVTMNWAMLYMVLNPDVQTKVRQELDANIGTHKKAKMSDKIQTPYTEAVLHEIQRKGNILPMSVFHCTTRDQYVKIDKFQVPPKTAIIPLIGDIMHDPEYFPNPTKFDPERYLKKTSPDDPGHFQAHPRVIPFGIGKRRCLGEVLARTSLYKFFTALIQKYEISSGQSQPIEDKADNGFNKAPVPYFLTFKPRKY